MKCSKIKYISLKYYECSKDKYAYKVLWNAAKSAMFFANVNHHLERTECIKIYCFNAAISYPGVGKN